MCTSPHLAHLLKTGKPIGKSQVAENHSHSVAPEFAIEQVAF
jgi:hypothetical protein